jgi:hypothetical protein
VAVNSDIPSGDCPADRPTMTYGPRGIPAKTMQTGSSEHSPRRWGDPRRPGPSSRPGGGNYALYAHFQPGSIGVKEGDRVAQDRAILGRQ